MKTICKKLLLLLLFPMSIFAQGNLQGTVTDKAGEPLAGVNVVVQGTKNGTATDFDGKFMLSNLKKGDVIAFTFLGYKNQTLSYTGQKEAKVVLEDETQSLQEMVVVGYGSVKKKDATGSVSLITTKDFNKGANVTTENLLNGRVAGVTINTSGAPGSGSEIRIRGGASLAASNDPLIVIDGFPLEGKTNVGSTSFLASLNPNTIESISVLKDASATAIFGSRASNGVIMITTKKGGKDLQVEYNFQYGSGKIIDKVDVFSADEFRDLVAQKHSSLVGKLGNANTDWQDEIYRRTDLVDNNLSLRGSLFGKIPARLSIGNTYQEGLRLTNYFNRNSLSLALNPSFLDNHLKIKTQANYTNERNRFTDGVEGSAISFDPTQPVYLDGSPYEGFFEYYNPSNNELTPSVPRNPVAQLLQTFDLGKNNRFFGNFEVDYKFHFFPALRAVVNVGYDESFGRRDKTRSHLAASSFVNNNIAKGTLEYSNGFRKNKLLDSYLVYNKELTNLNIEVTGGYSYQKYEVESYSSQNIIDPTHISDIDTATDVVNIGFFARTNLNFYDKYLLTLSYRRDGSSRFAEDNRWGNFPAVAFGWKLKDEFFAENKAISDLKLRLGWGVTGQQEISESDVYFQKISLGDGKSQYIFGTLPYALAIPKYYNPKIKWEETTTYNVGFDYGLWDRFTGSLDFFYKKSDDLFSDTAISDGSNFSNFGIQNIGEMSSKGVEFSLNAKLIENEKFQWNANFNASKFERRIEYLDLETDILLGGTGVGTGGTAQIHRVDYTPSAFYVYRQLYNPDGSAIEGAYADINGDGIVNGDDRYIYYNQDPDLTLGFATNMNYKNFDFSFNLRASLGNHVYNAINAGKAQYALINNNGALGNIHTSVLDTNFNTTTDVVLSDMFVENASFLRMDNISLGYTFQKWLAGKASLRLSAGVQNVFTITDYSGLDPEITGGIDNTIYPRQRTFLFGANVKF